MFSKKSAILKRFSRAGGVGEGMRRPDFKGLRRKLSVRLPDALLLNLQIIKVATGEDKGVFCERILTNAADQRIKELKDKHDGTAWSAIVGCAEASRR